MRTSALPLLQSHPTGYVLNPRRGFWSIIVPQAATNIVTNPSMETDINGYLTFSIGVRSQVSEKARRGAYSLKYTPSANSQDGVYYPFDGTYTGSGTLPPRLTAGAIYSISSDFFGWPGVPYEFYIEDRITSRRLAQIQFLGRGAWVRLAIRAAAGAAGGSGTEHWIAWRKVNSADTNPFYIDGVQVVQSLYDTTYLDGDQVGIVPRQVAYLWNGEPHNSTSQRLPETSAGGQIVSLDDAGLLVVAYTGFGMAPIENVSTPFAFSDGSVYQNTRTLPRDMTIVGRIEGRTLAEVQRNQTALLELVRPERNVVRQPLVLRYQAADCLDPTGEAVDFICAYRGGLEGDTQGLYQINIPISFTAFDPFGYQDGDNSVVTEALIRTVDNDFIAQRTAGGNWGGLDLAGFDGPVHALAYDASGNLWAGGAFSTAFNPSGVPIAASNVAYWDGTTWNEPDGGADGTVYAIAVGANNVVYVGGDFVNVGSIPLVVNYIAAWNAGVWQALDQGFDDIVYAIALDGAQRLYAAGAFLNDGGGNPMSHVAIYDPVGVAWSELGGGTNGNVQAMVVGPDGEDVYIGGNFITAGTGPTTVNRVARFSGSLWFPLGGGTVGMDGTVYSLLFLPDNTLLSGGAFTTAGGNDANHIAQWNGNVWGPLGSGVNNDVYAMAYDIRRRVLWAGGAFSTAGSIPTLDGFAGYNGSAWFVPDIDIIRPGFGSTCNVLAILAKTDGTLTIGFDDDSDDAEVPVLSIANNRGTADAYPIIYLSGTGDIYQIINYTTIESIYFDSLTLATGERIVIDLRPGQKTITSNTRGDIQYKVLPGSDLTTWRLAPGNNTISMLRTNATVDVSMVWRNRVHGVEGGTYR